MSTAMYILGRYKTRNRTGSNCCTIRPWTPDMLWKIPGFNMRADLASCTCHEDGTSTQQTVYSHIKHIKILAVYLESWSGVADPSLTSEGSTMPLPSLTLDSAMRSSVTSSVAHSGTARHWHRVLYSPHIPNKHHQRAPDGMSTSSELGQLLAHRNLLPIYN